MLVVLLVAVSYNVMAQETVRLTNGEWPPFLSEDIKYGGVASRIITEAFALEDIQVEYGFFPWKRSFMLAKKGTWDGSAIWAYNEERAEDFYYSDPVMNSARVFFHLKTTEFDWNAVEDLKGLKIGATIGYIYGTEFEELEKTGALDVHRIAEDEQNFAKLLKGRIQIFPQDIDVGYAMLNKIFSKEEAALFTHHPLPVKDDPLCLLLSKQVEGNEQLLETFNRGLKQLQESGKAEQYLSESRSGEYVLK
ncbi:MAG: amino acid ABC transporter substrate-binding protein [bacterium]|nr:amino acid ABC transporter substrate-binding protein [bacterium]